MATLNSVMPRLKRATIYDVARLAGVSHVTVTRTLSKGASVSKKTRDKVQTAIHRLDYQPNPLAQGLNGAATKTISIIWPMGYTFVSEKSIADLIARFQQQGYCIQMANTLNEIVMVKELLKKLLQRTTDAVVLNITPETLDKEVEDLLCQFRAATVVTVKPIEIAVDQIIWDRTSAVKAAVDHFVSAGRKRICYGFHTKKRLGNIASEPFKVNTFIARMREHGLESPEDGVVYDVDGKHTEDAEGLRQLVKNLFLAEKFPFDAFLCINDNTAAVLMQVLREEGLQVPRDVAVIGWDDSFVSKLCEPHLASVNRCNEDIIDVIEQTLFDRLKGKKLPIQKKEVSMKFVWHESAG